MENGSKELTFIWIIIKSFMLGCMAGVTLGFLQKYMYSKLNNAVDIILIGAFVRTSFVGFGTEKSLRKLILLGITQVLVYCSVCSIVYRLIQPDLSIRNILILFITVICYQLIAVPAFYFWKKRKAAKVD